MVWNSLTGFFENASICTYKPDADYSVLNYVLVNVHTSRISAYPSIVFLHNYASFPVTYRGYVYDARNGAYLGSFDLAASANESVGGDFSEIESVINFTPNSTQYHANIVFQAVSTIGNAYYGVAAQGINNLQLDAYTNMSVACGINL